MHHKSHDLHPRGLSASIGGGESAYMGRADPLPELGKRAIRILLECFVVVQLLCLVSTCRS